MLEITSSFLAFYQVEPFDHVLTSPHFLPGLCRNKSVIRPNKTSTHIDTACTAERHALKGAGFATSNQVAAAIRERAAAELADAVMAALGNRFERLSDEDVHILVDLYTAAPRAEVKTADAVVEPKGPNVLAE
jgi:hypothetical protein